MQAYIYNADMYCEDCGLAIRESLDSLYARIGIPTGFDPDDESSYDSGDYPKGPISQEENEADSPYHCGAGDRCLNALECPRHDDHKHGCFLENRLTVDGMAQLAKMYQEQAEYYYDHGKHDHSCGVVAELWIPFYNPEPTYVLKYRIKEWMLDNRQLLGHESEPDYTGLAEHASESYALGVGPDQDVPDWVFDLATEIE
jgi:hypothetical protein